MSFQVPPLPRSSFYDFLVAYGWSVEINCKSGIRFSLGNYTILLKNSTTDRKLTVFRLYTKIMRPDPFLYVQKATYKPVGGVVSNDDLETFPHWKFQERIEEWTIQAKMELVHAI